MEIGDEVFINDNGDGPDHGTIVDVRVDEFTGEGTYEYLVNSGWVEDWYPESMLEAA